MTEFLDLNSPRDFWKILKTEAKVTPDNSELVNYTEALGRITASPIRSPEDLPAFDRSTVDGYAVKAKDTAGASESLPVYFDLIGEVLMGENCDLQINSGQAIKIPTGGMLPEGADAVIMVEHTELFAEKKIETSQAVAKGENVVIRGEDISQNELLFEKGHQIRPQDLGALSGLGITELEVYRSPKVSVISTGDEIIPPDETPAPGEIRDINSYTIGSLFEDLGARVNQVGIIGDTFEELTQAIEVNLDSDMILISGGSSVGVKDLTIDVLNSLGEPGVRLHGISIKPGKPTILAIIDQIPVIGLPGHPASAWTISNQLVKPLVKSLKGYNQSIELNLGGDQTHQAVLTRNIASDRGREEYVPVRVKPCSENKNMNSKDKKTINQQNSIRCKQLNSGLSAKPVLGKSSLITTLVKADGLIKIDSYSEGLPQGEIVTVNLF